MPAFPAPLAAALDAKGFGALTPVQEAVLDPALAGRDLLVSAQTGSGKTVAFGLAMAQALLDEDDTLPRADTPRALIVAPTRELALQVRREFEWLYAEAGAIIASCVGGMDIRTERRTLERGAHIVVGTPGRLRDHLERASLDPALIATVVLDEADEMLDLGFREDLEFILSALPTERRTLMFSATVSDGIERLARTFQQDAARVTTAASDEAHADIAYRALTVAQEDAENAIVNVLRYHEAKNALVFCKTRATVNHLTARLLNRGFAVVPLSGELAQDERARALQAMRDGRARVCVATDVAARGIDLPGLELVIHADLPSNSETLLHRSGRTGRAGRKGTSALIVPTRARRKTERLLSEAGVAAEWGAAPTAADVSARDTERLFTDDALTAPETTEEHALITALIERFTPRELAAGVVRQYFSARSAPEDIAAVTDAAPAERARASFERSFWVRLDIGRDKRAEPRWLLPLLCRAGDLTRDDIGAIRILDDATLVQLHADAEARFFNALGDDAQLEQDISVTRSAAPSGGARPERSTGKPRGARPGPRSGPRPDARTESRPAVRPGCPDNARSPRQDKPEARKDAPQSAPRPDRPAPRPQLAAAAPADRAATSSRPDTRPRPDSGADRSARRTPPTDNAPRRPEDTGKPFAGRKAPGAGKPPHRGPKSAASPEGAKYPPRKRPEGSDTTPRKPRPAAPAAPARPERKAALDPSARLDRPGAKPRAGARKGTDAKGGPAKPRGAKGKPPRGRTGPGDGSTPPYRPRRG
ncbi:DEAD/DEAH box helicase [Pararhodobacter sp. SW119]|uniref:DEAD/DEAH box helicase n=1 Tax=Pararhodobacter sp. SW119 TaxID=2780075 RepID=UPI001ADFF7E9|nr:DEAD/DEAH box helicase [Pararhodobacter sp. SW119]